MVNVEDIVPVLNVPAQQAAQLAIQSFVPLHVAGDRKYLMSLRHGNLADRSTLFKLLSGTYEVSHNEGHESAPQSIE